MKLFRILGLLVVTLLLATSPALAATGDAVAGGWTAGLIAIGAGIGLGIAAAGAGLGQGRAAASAMESIGRNPNAADRIFTPLIVSLALMEALALYALVIAFILAGKIPALG
jgi:F-type H+-transporting ATPase subunit c